MGGEKLKMYRPCRGAFFAVHLIIAGFLLVSHPLAAQTTAQAVPDQSQTTGSPPASAAGTDESLIIIGDPAVAPAAGGGSSILVVLRMVLVLALAALAIYGVVFFIKRLARPQELKDPHLKVLARVSLGADSFAAVVSVGARAWLVGGGSGAVNLISEIDDPESLETMLLDDARKNADTGTRRFPDFRSLISRMGGASREGGMHSGGKNADSGQLDNLRKQRERLKGL